MCNGSVVKFTNLLGRVAFEGDGATVGESRWLVVYRFADAECAAVVTVKQPGVPGIRITRGSGSSGTEIAFQPCATAVSGTQQTIIAALNGDEAASKKDVLSRSQRWS